ncbi:putative electron transfer flavoprotein FixA [Raoultibacter timonensis]|uniref:Electron transfer flavoprotein small subunit n=1 Tax=Raoultibacter timonensis TaxID=1907662 RepID=A0ABN6MHC1_9ACTN|nr:putative electron transfer flavoprotein FixA [Raoultibacter timonensis]BDE95696.1 electron transfer flavoprotein FixB [Raoultibacter timonensis]BDF50300.1 electron transfer flavoprotein FixB [Raoultibacter timonensis]
MNTVACYKVVPDAQDIDVNPDKTLNLDKAEMILGEYDLVAIEEAAKLAEATGGSAALLSAGGEKLNDTKLVKAALSRGAQELYCVIDPVLDSSDAFQTASVLAAALGKIDYDLVVCGEGSGDLYAQQVGSLVGALLGVPVVNAVSSIEAKDGAVVVERTLENEVEVLEVTLPAVVSVTTDINLPRIPQLKDILAAGKKPVVKWTLDEVGGLPESPVETVSVLAPENIERKHVVYESATDENIGELVTNIKASW